MLYFLFYALEADMTLHGLMDSLCHFTICLDTSALKQRGAARMEIMVFKYMISNKITVIKSKCQQPS